MTTFHHIHCSSRFDRSPQSLDFDLTVWRESSSIITLTEITNDRRAATMRSVGWDYYNHNIGVDSDNCGICWRKETWGRTYGKVQRLSDSTFDRLNGLHGLYIYSCTVILKHQTSGLKLLVSVTHMPAHIEGNRGFNTTDAGWAARKAAFLTGLDNWSKHVKDQVSQHKVDGVMIIADWNLDLKADWVRHLLRDHWGPKYHHAWKVFTGAGGVLIGGVDLAPGTPGAGTHDRIIDGTLYKDMKVTDGPHLMERRASSDHRPYRESFRFLNLGEPPEPDEDGNADGETYEGEAWWGFGDYMNDEIYFTPADEPGTGEAGGEVL